MTAEVFHAPMSWLNAVANYVCGAGVEWEKIGGESEEKGRDKEKGVGDGRDGREREGERDGKKGEKRERERNGER